MPGIVCPAVLCVGSVAKCWWCVCAAYACSNGRVWSNSRARSWDIFNHPAAHTYFHSFHVHPINGWTFVAQAYISLGVLVGLPCSRMRVCLIPDQCDCVAFAKVKFIFCQYTMHTICATHSAKVGSHHNHQPGFFPGFLGPIRGRFDDRYPCLQMMIRGDNHMTLCRPVAELCIKWS